MASRELFEYEHSEQTNQPGTPVASMEDDDSQSSGNHNPDNDEEQVHW